MGNAGDQMQPRMDSVIKGILGCRFCHRFGHIFGQYYTRDNVHDAGPAWRVPTFYAGELTDNEVKFAYISGMFIAMVFGGIHCLAWSSSQLAMEQLLWHSASLTIIRAPVLMMIHPLLIWDREDLDIVRLAILYFIFLGASFFYALGRLLLLVLPFLYLRSLPARGITKCLVDDVHTEHTLMCYL